MGQIPGLTITLRSSGDMSSNQFKAVLASTSNAAGACTVVATRGGRLTGVYLDDSTGTDDGAVQVTGVARMLAGDSSAMETAITLGSVVVASSKGQAVPSTGAGQYKLGYAMGSLSTGSTGVIDVLLTVGAITT